MGELSDYLSVREAAAELGLSKSRVEQLVRGGRLPSATLAGRRYVLKADVARLKAEPRPPRGRRPKGGPPPAAGG